MFRLSVFLVLNFAALYFGSLLMGGSPADNEWYISLKKAPWTPPGWLFGVAWTFIMICFSVYMWKLAGELKGKQLSALYLIFAVQWVLNVVWNPLFFNWHLVLPALIVLMLLVAVLVFLQINFADAKPIYLWTILPYLLWLSIAFSLNFYVLIRN
jgi:tryptophan-rich sensory protein